MSVRFLFTTLQFVESEAYGRVGALLAERGHQVSHVTVSRRAAEALRGAGFEAVCLPDAVGALPPCDVESEAARLERQNALPSLRSVWISDPACRGRSQEWCLRRTVAQFRALERVFDEAAPQIVVPEVGSETMRTAAHAIAVARGATTLFMFLTIFPRPLRLYRDTPHAPIVAPEELRELDDEERAEVEAFIEEYVRANRPTIGYRSPRITPLTLRDFARHVAVRALYERDNEYLRPGGFVTAHVRQMVRRTASGRIYQPAPAERDFVYFPLHVTDDFKIRRVIPHCVDQRYLIEQVADALPHGVDLVLKEHPASIGRNPIPFLREVTRRDNVRLVAPTTSSHDLIRRARAVAVISSTVGLEALLHGSAVLTLGQPFYSGYGLTVDVDSFREIREAMPRVLAFRPDRERILRFLHAAMRSTYEGAPAGWDPSTENVRRLAGSLDAVARDHAPHGAVTAG